MVSFFPQQAAPIGCPLIGPSKDNWLDSFTVRHFENAKIWANVLGDICGDTGHSESTMPKFQREAQDLLSSRLSLRDLNVDFLGGPFATGFKNALPKARASSLTDYQHFLRSWQPGDPRQVALLLGLQIGWDDEESSDLFYLSVITDELRPQFSRRAEATIFVAVFEWEKVLVSILKIIRKCERRTWDESCNELRKRFEWEYEGIPGA